MNNMDGPPQAAARPSPARALLGAVARRAGQVIGLTPPRVPAAVGESPFVQSVAGSSIRSPAAVPPLRTEQKATSTEMQAIPM